MSRARLPCALVAALLVLGACGKKGDLRAPDGEEAAYTYPRVYPKPSTVGPQGSPAPPRSREVPRGSGDISPFPQSRRSVTYGDPAAP